MNCKLGKLPPKHDLRTLQFGDYLLSLPAIPTTKSWGAGIRPWPVMGNDQIGNCTTAAAAHLIQEWTANNLAMYVPPDRDVIAAYSAVSGYDPATGYNDNGATCLDVLNYWRAQGISTHRIFAYTQLQPGNKAHVAAATYLFGGAYLGMSLPWSCQAQIRPSGLWTLDPAYPKNPDSQPGSWGGHCVPVVAYTPQVLTVITWGMPMSMTWAFFNAYCDEAYCCLSSDWAPNGKTSPVGFNLSQLQQDLSQVIG